MTSLQNPSPDFRLIRAHSMLAFVAIVVGVGGLISPIVPTQRVYAIDLPGMKAAAPEEKVVRPLEAWQAEVKEKLAETAALHQQAVEDSEREPSTALTKQVELLKRLDLTLSQLVAKLSNRSTAESNRDQAQADLDLFHQAGIDVSKPIPFLRFDLARDELASELQRLQRNKQALAAVKASLENANQDFKERNRLRRQAKENYEEQTSDAERGLYRVEHLEAKLQCDLAEAIARLRKEEFLDASLANETQQLKVNLEQERVTQLETAVAFDSSDLKLQFAKIDRQSDRLERKIAEFESSSPKVKYLEQQWMRAQRQLDSSTGDDTAIQEEKIASELGIKAMQEELSLLREQLDRLASQRKLWSRRQQVFSDQPERKSLRLWEEEADEALVQLDSKQRSQNQELEKIRDLLKPIKTRLDETPEEAPEVYWLQQQVKSLDQLLSANQQNLESIRVLQLLNQKLRNELNSDSLAASAKDGIIDVWDAIGSAWNYELAANGDLSITVQKIITALLIVLAGFVFSKALSRWLGKQVLRRLDFDPSATATIQSLFYYVLLVMFTLFALKVVRVPLTAFTVLGGAVALGVGFGSQNLINNFISGLVLLAERPVKVGDLIQIEDLYGNIEHIGARSTRVRTGSNLEIILPNRVLLQEKLINYTLSSDKVRTLVEVGVAYGTDLVLVTKQLRRAATETGRVSKDPPPIVLFKSFGDSALVFEVHFWIRMRTAMDRLQIESAVRYRIDQLFREENLTIAFPQQDVHLDMSTPLTVQMVEQSPTSPGAQS